MKISFPSVPRHTNIAISACLHVSFLMGASFLLVTNVAVFVACTVGISGGKTLSYVALAFGPPIANLGYTILFYHVDYGLDPYVMIGWENQTKRPFFTQILICGWVSTESPIRRVATLPN